MTARLHAWAPAGAADAPIIAAHQGSVAGGNNQDARDARAAPQAVQGQALGEAGASSSGDQQQSMPIEVLSSSEEDREQPAGQAFSQQVDTRGEMQLRQASSCSASDAGGLDVMSMD